KYALKKFGCETQDRDVSEINVHPWYNFEQYRNDIAVLRLADPVDITRNVGPVCLWNDIDDINEIEGELGTVVGWGFDHNKKLTTNLMQAQMPVVDKNTCVNSNRELFLQFITDQSFCAGFRNGTSVCNGDSGGGLVFPRRGTHGPNTIWQIRGLVSIGVALKTGGFCDTTQYTLFTDVAKHVDWIEDIVLSDNQ
ncbi:hypothetical protein HHI36_021371, partial [Cryptolaemus montrouzieri]